MTDLLLIAADSVFQYPSSPYTRRHGPRGYSDYTSYKPWLRDEFTFRCVYCLTRERWRHDGHEGFSVDHFESQSSHPQRSNDYDNLFYVCCACNGARSAIPLPIDPSRESLGAHMRITRDGVAEPLTADGAKFIAICHHNRPAMIDFRRRFLRLIETLAGSESLEAMAALQELLAFPDDLSDLTMKRPPGGNTHPGGVAESFFEKRQRGELPNFY